MRGIKHQVLYKNGGVPKSRTGCEEALLWGKVRADQKNKVNRDGSEKKKQTNKQMQTTPHYFPLHSSCDRFFDKRHHQGWI